MAPADLVASRSPSRWLAVVLVCVGAILFILWLGRERAGTPTSQAQTVPEASASARRAGHEARGTPAVATPAVPPPSSRAAVSAASEEAVGTVGEAGVQPVAPPAADGKPVDLLIVAERASWLVMTVDGTRIARRRLQPREAVHVQMRSRATLRTGDAGALKMSMNGGAFSPLGPPGAVRTIEITPPAQ